MVGEKKKAFVKQTDIVLHIHHHVGLISFLHLHQSHKSLQKPFHIALWMGHNHVTRYSNQFPSAKETKKIHPKTISQLYFLNKRTWECDQTATPCASQTTMSITRSTCLALHIRSNISQKEKQNKRTRDFHGARSIPGNDNRHEERDFPSKDT